ncbi:MAG: TetM/TetW/TetO/TetS family tetracycline resistance ribosomal protection protein [Eubacterium sp.]|nr:TetM/TetW/TetO/TetS family tetracycline resistance ribosomal protection protein [Eubacterium sp.]
MKKLCIGILAHVDAGKTTLTESILYDLGAIRTAGRVDKGDAFLDTEVLEKKRGVTILAKQAICRLDRDSEMNKSGEDVRITIIDTPGHADFIGETERALSVLDAAILLVSASDGVTSGTKRLAGMLRKYKVPYYVFVNKMDMSLRSEEELLSNLEENLGDGFVKYEDFPEKNEEIAALSEVTIERFLEEGSIGKEDICTLFSAGRLHPVSFGSALKNINIDGLISMITEYSPKPEYKDEFSAKIYKIGFEDGHKLSYAKVTGGSISVREAIDDERIEGQKISQIRMYSGVKYDSIEKAEAGDAVVFVGLLDTYAGMGLGEEYDEDKPVFQPVLRYDLELPQDMPLRIFLPKLLEIVAEDPLLSLEIGNNDRAGISVMGEFQAEILRETIKERYNVDVKLVKGRFVHKETIKSPVIGYGHFEPLRHYAEVQILLEPLPRGTGIEVASDLSVNELDINWQKTIISTMTEHLPTGVLTGSRLTDIRLTLIAGRSHLKHTDSRDFYEAVRRAVRQGLMKTESVLLEPQYSFTMHLPVECVGRAMTDISEMGGSCNVAGEGVLTGSAAARCISDYQSKLTEYSSGEGTIELQFAGYLDVPAEEAERYIAEKGYDPETDRDNPSGSIFIDHGAGYYVPWFECEALMHLPNIEQNYFEIESESDDERLKREAELVRLASECGRRGSLAESLEAIGTDEIDDILKNATHSNAGKEGRRTKRVYLSKNTVLAERRSASSVSYVNRNGSPSGSNTAGAAGSRSTKQEKKKYLLVDGYNIIHAWDELKKLIEGAATKDKQSISLEAARFRLLDMMSEYRALADTEVIVVFDAYNVKGHSAEKMDYLGVHVVYTRTAETADHYIAKFTVENSKKFDITVATSDCMIQLIIRGEDSKFLSAPALELEYKELRKNCMEQF